MSLEWSPIDRQEADRDAGRAAVGMTRKLRDAALGAATVALLLYAAVTTTRNISGTMPAPAQSRAGCATAAPACAKDGLQLARSRGP